MSKKPTNFWDDYLNIRIKWEESSATKAKNRKKPDRLTEDGTKIPKNVFKVGGHGKYKAIAVSRKGGERVVSHIGVFDSIEEAVKAQFVWKKAQQNRRAAHMREVKDAGKKVIDKYAKAIKNLGDR